MNEIVFTATVRKKGKDYIASMDGFTDWTVGSQECGEAMITAQLMQKLRKYRESRETDSLRASNLNDLG